MAKPDGKYLPKFEAFSNIFAAIIIARKIMVPMTKITTIMKTTPSTPGTMLKGWSTKWEKSKLTLSQANSQCEQEHPVLFCVK